MNADTPARFLRRHRLLGVSILVVGLLSALLYLVSLDDRWDNRDRLLLEAELETLHDRQDAVHDLRHSLGFGGVTQALVYLSLSPGEAARAAVETALDRAASKLAAVETADPDVRQAPAFSLVTDTLARYRQVYAQLARAGDTPQGQVSAQLLSEDDGAVRALMELERRIDLRVEDLRAQLVAGQQAIDRRSDLRLLLLGVLVGASVLTLLTAARHGSKQHVTSTQAQQLNLFLAELPDAVVACDVDGRIVRFNHASERLFGYGRDQVLGKPLEMLIPDEVAGHHIHNVQRFFRDPQGARMTSDRVVSAKTVSGRAIAVEVGMAAFSGPHGNEAVAVLRNVDERQALQREVARTQRLRAVGQLAAGVAHEFNNIMQVVSGASQLLALEEEANKPLTTRIDDAVQRATDLTRKLASYAQVDVQRPALAPWRQAVDEALENLSRMTGRGALVVQVEGPDAGWGVFADQERLASALLQLLDNARAASPPGKDIHLLVTGWRAESGASAQAGRLPEPCNGWILYAVQDYGRGIGAQELEQIFDPFFSSDRGGESSGLGLPMVRGFARQSGGQILVESVPGEGTTASLRLPGVITPDPSGGDGGTAVS